MIMKAAISTFILTQWVLEHKLEEYPEVAPLSPILTGFAILVVVPGYFYNLFQHSTNNTGIWCSLLFYIGMVVVCKSFDICFPKDDPEEQVLALKDPKFNGEHMLLHLLIFANFFYPYVF